MMMMHERRREMRERERDVVNSVNGRRSNGGRGQRWLDDARLLLDDLAAQVLGLVRVDVLLFEALDELVVVLMRQHVVLQVLDRLGRLLALHVRLHSQLLHLQPQACHVVHPCLLEAIRSARNLI